MSGPPRKDETLVGSEPAGVSGNNKRLDARTYTPEAAEPASPAKDPRTYLTGMAFSSQKGEECPLRAAAFAVALADAALIELRRLPAPASFDEVRRRLDETRSRLQRQEQERARQHRRQRLRVVPSGRAPI